QNPVQRFAVPGDRRHERGGRRVPSVQMIERMASKLATVVHGACQIADGCDLPDLRLCVQEPERYVVRRPCTELFEDPASLPKRCYGRVIESERNDGNGRLDRQGSSAKLVC